MVASLLVSLFALSALFGMVVLADGMVRGRHAWRQLRAELQAMDSWQVAVVRFDDRVRFERGDLPGPARRAVTCHTGRVMRRPVQPARQPQRVAA